MEIVNYYAKLKIESEKIRKNINDIEISILKKMFLGEVLEFKKLGLKGALDVAKKILQVEYPNAVILNMLKIDKIATLAGLETGKKFPSELLVFDAKNKRIIGVELVVK